MSILWNLKFSDTLRKNEQRFSFIFFVQGTYYMCRRWGQNLYAIETTKVYWILCCLNVANGEFYTFLSKKCCYVAMEIWIWLRKKILLCMLKLNFKRVLFVHVKYLDYILTNQGSGVAFAYFSCHQSKNAICLVWP